MRKQAGVRLVGEAGRDKVRMERYDDGFDKGALCPQTYDRYRQAGGGGRACHYETSGGYYLAKPADQIRIGDVLRATEGSCMPVACVDDEGKCGLADGCEARGFWRGMGNAINAYIDRITLADVLEGNVEA